MEKRKTDMVVTGYLFNSEDKLLLIHHKKLNLWLPVGGHMETNETPDEALLREFKEEVGFDVAIVGRANISDEGNVKQNLATPFHVNVHSVGDHDHCSLFYICRVKDSSELEINKDELNDFRWVDKVELSDGSVPVDVKNIGLEAYRVWEQTKF